MSMAVGLTGDLASISTAYDFQKKESVPSQMPTEEMVNVMSMFLLVDAEKPHYREALTKVAPNFVDRINRAVQAVLPQAPAEVPLPPKLSGNSTIDAEQVKIYVSRIVCMQMFVS